MATAKTLPAAKTDKTAKPRAMIILFFIVFISIKVIKIGSFLDFLAK
jgi:hypothetical protein